MLFAIGLLGASILASTVLPLSTVYAITEALVGSGGWTSAVKMPGILRIVHRLDPGQLVICHDPGLPLFQIMWLSQSVNAILLPILLLYCF
jgi:Mn2+/Fe2+ NRAMP family transporter